MASFALARTSSLMATTTGGAPTGLQAKPRRGTMIARAVASPRGRSNGRRKSTGGGVFPSAATSTTTTAAPSSSSSSSASSSSPSSSGSTKVRSNVVSATSLHAPGPQPRLFAQEVLAGPAPGRLANRATSFIEEHRVRGYEVGPERGASITTIANLLQEVAGNHAVALWGRTDAGYATDPIMVARNLIFAATRIQIQMDEYPRWGDMVQVETWFQEEGRVAATRNWLLRDALSGKPLGRATSTWVMVNTKTRRLAKMPDEMRAKMDFLAPNPPRDAVEASQARLKIPDLSLEEEGGGGGCDGGSDGSEERRASGGGTSSTGSYDFSSSGCYPPNVIEGPKQVARRADMDMNGHINNVTYLAWALETVPSDVYDHMTLHEVEIDYKSECLAGQMVECLAAPAARGSVGGNGSSDDGTKAFVHMLRRCDDERCYELVRARTTWRPAADGAKKR